MNGWQVPWALAQITGVLFSTLIWIVVLAASPIVLPLVLLAGAVLVAGHEPRRGLWWWFGARPAVPGEASSGMVTMVEAYSTPWRLATRLWRCGGVVFRSPFLVACWRLRWLVFAVAIVQSWQAGRWASLIAVLTIAVLSWTTGIFENQWSLTRDRLGRPRTAPDGEIWGRRERDIWALWKKCREEGLRRMHGVSDRRTRRPRSVRPRRSESAFC